VIPPIKYFSNFDKILENFAGIKLLTFDKKKKQNKQKERLLKQKSTSDFIEPSAELQAQKLTNTLINFKITINLFEKGDRFMDIRLREAYAI
jgi:hypothetical protein